MEKQISSRVLKLQGQVEIPEDLQMEAYKIYFEGEVRKIEESDNDDGTLTKTFKFMPLIGEIADSLGKITKTRDARKESQKMRAIIRHEWLESGSNLSEEDYYKQRMTGLNRKILNREI